MCGCYYAGILDSGGNMVVEYRYNAWGGDMSISGTMCQIMGELNPFRYRGYYFDQESGLYYLNSRYYDPEIGRWVSPDNTETMLEHLDDSIFATNLYAYCLNNPVNYFDPTGEFAITILAIAGVTLLWGVTTAVCIYAVNTPQFQEGWKNLYTGIGSWFSDVGRSVRITWNQQIAQYQAITNSVTATIQDSIANQILKAETKVRNRVKKSGEKIYRFFEIWFDNLGIPILGKPLIRQQAISRTKRGLNSITFHEQEARYVANVAGGSRAVYHQKHGGAGFFNHYHINGHKNSAHIYFLSAG